MSHLAAEIQELFDELQEPERVEADVYLAMGYEYRLAYQRQSAQERKEPCNAHKLEGHHRSQVAYVQRREAYDPEYKNTRRQRSAEFSVKRSAERKALRISKWANKAEPIPGFGIRTPEPVAEEVAQKLLQTKEKQAAYARQKRSRKHEPKDTATPLLDLIGKASNHGDEVANNNDKTVS